MKTPEVSMTSQSQSVSRLQAHAKPAQAETDSTPRNRLMFWLAMALAPDAVTWNWGGYTPALLSYAHALREAHPAPSAAAVEDTEAVPAAPMARAA